MKYVKSAEALGFEKIRQPNRAECHSNKLLEWKYKVAHAFAY
jgi:hypothetical protein